jgi:hypothetical protein
LWPVLPATLACPIRLCRITGKSPTKNAAE